MDETLEKVRAFIERHRLLEGARGVIVALSGGPDSVAVLDILMRLQPSLRLHIAHLDHMLRGRESTDDATFVTDLAARLSVPATVDRVDVRAAAMEAGRGIEDMARELRYRFLQQAAHREDCSLVATGHTMNDQAETFLMRLMRGSGLRGLAAMRPIRQLGNGENGELRIENEKSVNQVLSNEAEPESIQRPGKGGIFNSQFSILNSSFPPLLIRPLLCITRDEIEAYCLERQLRFRVDPSNLTLDYARNRVRRTVLPILQELNPGVVQHIARTAEIIADEHDALDQLVLSLLDKAEQVRPLGDTVSEAAYSVPALLSHGSAIRRRIIIEALRRSRAWAAHIEAGQQIEARHIEAVEGLLGEERSGRRISLPGGLEVWREFDAIVVRPSSGRPGVNTVESKLQEYEHLISIQTPLAHAGGLAITLVRGQPGDLLNPAIEQARRGGESEGQDWMTAVLDDTLLPELLIVRPRRSGERAHVLGRNGTKKLKNLMIGHRIPTSRRAYWPVVATQSGQYVWSPGLPPADEYAARDETHALAILRASGI